MNVKPQRIFRLIDQKRHFQNPWITVCEENAIHEITGKPIHYHVIRHQNPSIVVVVKNGSKVLVEEIDRYPIGQRTLEFPAGGMEAGETAEEAAVREVCEETGITIQNERMVYRFYPSDGTSDQLIYIVTADYSAGEIVVQQSELHDAYWMEAETLKKRIADNTVRDSLTLIAALLFA